MMSNDNTKKCSECNLGRIYKYSDMEWTIWICWKCGHYEDNTPAFSRAPYLFKDLVRNDPLYFMNKYCRPPTNLQQPEKTPDEDNTTKNLVTTIILVIF